MKSLTSGEMHGSEKEQLEIILYGHTQSNIIVHYCHPYWEPR